MNQHLPSGLSLLKPSRPASREHFDKLSANGISFLAGTWTVLSANGVFE